MQISRRTIVTINDQDVTSQITSGTLRLTEMIADGEFQFGQLCADMFECQIYGLDANVVGLPIFVNVIEDEDIAYLKANNGYLLNDENGKYIVNTTPATRLFTGTIDSCTKDFSNSYRDIVAYNFNRQNEDVTNWWNGLWATQGTTQPTYTIKYIRTNLMTHMGITEVDKTLPNDDLIVSADVVGNDGTGDNVLTFSYVLQCIGEIQRCFPHINRNGAMEYITLGTTTKSLADKYELNRSDWQDKITEIITGVAIYSTSNTFVQGVGTYENPYTIAGNLLLLNMTSEQLNTFLTDYFNAIKDIQYTPCDINLIVSDFSYRLGDKISFDGNTSYIFENTYSGIQYVDELISAGGDVKRSKEVKTVNNTIIESKKFVRVTQDINGIRTEVQAVADDLSTNYSTTQQTETMITSEVGRLTPQGNNLIKRSNTYDYPEYGFIVQE